MDPENFFPVRNFSRSGILIFTIPGMLLRKSLPALFYLIRKFFSRINRLADSTTYVVDTAPISGPIDFQKRLQNLRIKRNEEINDENKIEKSEEFKMEKNEISPKEHLKSLAGM